MASAYFKSTIMCKIAVDQNKEDRMGIKVYKFTEHNDWEGESWNFFIGMNEKQYLYLNELISGLDGTYELSEKTYENETIFALVNESNDGYMPEYNDYGVLTGKIFDVKKEIFESCDDPFYKGGDEKGLYSIHTPGGNQNVNFINESGLYSLALSSRKPEAKRFKKWVTSIVIPSIRKTGKYEVQKPLEVKVLEVIQELQKKIEQDKPKVEYYQNVLQSESLITTTQIAADLGITPQPLNKKLHDFGIQYKVNGQWILVEKYKDCGYTKSKTYPYVDDDGVNQTSIHTYWTEKGREFIMDLCITGEND
jgi:anti-repressor protein